MERTYLEKKINYCNHCGDPYEYTETINVWDKVDHMGYPNGSTESSHKSDFDKIRCPTCNKLSNKLVYLTEGSYVAFHFTNLSLVEAAKKYESLYKTKERERLISELNEVNSNIKHSQDYIKDKNTKLNLLSIKRSGIKSLDNDELYSDFLSLIDEDIEKKRKHISRLLKDLRFYTSKKNDIINSLNKLQE